MEVGPAGRSYCYRCLKPERLCVCQDLAPLLNRTPIRILQHPREQFHAIGTARLARLGLSSVDLVLHERGEVAAAEARLLRGLTRPAVLYPAPGARLLQEIPASERPDGLVVLDGTWTQAKKLWRDHPWLHALPAVSLAPRSPSVYRIRPEPNPLAVSTIEAIAQALEILEPELAATPHLIGAFSRMIDRQLERSVLSAPRPKRRRAGRNRAGLEALLGHRAAQVVLVYAEHAPPPREGAPRELVYVAAQRWTEAERFQLRVRPPSFSDTYPTERHLAFMGLARAELVEGARAEDLAERLSAFLRPGDALAAWNQSTLDFLRPWIGPARPEVLLKAVYGNLRQSGAKAGALSEVAMKEGVHPVKTPFLGRADRVLGQLLPLLEHLAK
ncbi:MAG: tRNA-uridine aminocarboxypropyltransferase [Myxococcota bacterium]